MGHTKLSEEEKIKRFKRLIHLVYEGSTLREGLKKVGLSWKVFDKVGQRYPDLQGDITRARVLRVESLAQEVIEIADTEEDPQKARNMIDARKWYASKIAPKTYGDRVDVNVTETVNIRHALDDARARVALPNRAPTLLGGKQVSEIIDVSPDKSSGLKPDSSSSKIPDDDIFQ